MSNDAIYWNLEIGLGTGLRSVELYLWIIIFDICSQHLNRDVKKAIDILI